MIGSNGALLDAMLVPLLIVVAISICVLVAWLGRSWLQTRASRQPSVDLSQGLHGPSAPEEPQVAHEPVPATVPPYLVGLRAEDAGGWTIHIAGRTYSALDAVPDPVLRDQVVAALRALVDFSRGYIQRTKGSTPPASPQSATTPVPPLAAHPVPLRTTEHAPGASVLGEAPLHRDVAPGATVPTIDLAKEIGDIVEEMLDRSPALHSHSIRLQNVPGQGIAFVVDGIRYRELGDIPIPEVQTLIREATKEWERR